MKNIIMAVRGGKRKGAGRKSKYGEPTETISFRVPKSLKEYLINLVNEKLNDKRRI